MRRFIVVAAVLMTVGSSALLADHLPGNAVKNIDEFWKTRSDENLTNLVDNDIVMAYIFERVAEEQQAQLPLELLRADLHPGALASALASTSVVARPSTTDLISIALESGAVSRTVDDKSVTFGLNALPVLQLMSGGQPLGCGTVTNDCVKGPGRWIRGLSGSLTVNNSTTTVPVPSDVASSLSAPSSLAAFLASSNTVQAAAFRYEFFVRERDSAKAQKALDDAAAVLSAKMGESGVGTTLADFTGKLRGALSNLNWRADTLVALRGSRSKPEMSRVYLDRLRIAYKAVADAPELRQLRDTAQQEVGAYIAAQNAVLAEKLYRKSLTLDYVNQRPSVQPGSHEVRLVMSTPLGSKPKTASLAAASRNAAPSGMLTFNSGVSFYGSDAGGRSHRVRDAQTSFALDWSPAAWGAIRPTYTFAYYFQYMVENGILKFTGEALTPGGSTIRLASPAIEVLDTKGALHVAQLRLNIPVSTTGVSFPAAFSYSSRAELIPGNKSFWQGHIGVSYDFSSLKTFLRSSVAR